MKLNTSLTGAASRNGTSAGSLAGRHRQAFTLIELLVVIAIISMLMGVLIFFCHEAWKEAKHVEWISKLREAGIAIQLYANDNDGRFPNPDLTDLSQVPLKVMEALKPYVKSKEIFWCPFDPDKSMHPGGSLDYRVTHDPKTSLAGVRLDLIRHPERVIIAGDRSAGWHKTGMINVLYLDGHVEQVTEEKWWININTPVEFL